MLTHQRAAPKMHTCALFGALWQNRQLWDRSDIGSVVSGRLFLLYVICFCIPCNVIDCFWVYRQYTSYTYLQLPPGQDHTM